jgi:transposase
MAMTTLADSEVRVTGGVDTHKDTHVAAALDQQGRVLGTEAFPATTAGYRSLLRWLASFGPVTVVGVEGTGAWGAGLARSLTAQAVTVIEVRRGSRQHRRRHGKSDPTDAISAARSVQSGEEHGVAKTADGAVESIRLLDVARRSAIKARSQTANHECCQDRGDQRE